MNQTRQDAFDRIIEGRVGSLVTPSDTYMFALREFLCQWIQDIDAHIAYVKELEEIPSDNMDEL